MAITRRQDRVGAGLSAILSVNLVRLGAVALLLACSAPLQPDHRSSIFVLTWGGLRGGLSIALALSVPKPSAAHGCSAQPTWSSSSPSSIQGGSMDWILRRGNRSKLAA